MKILVAPLNWGLGHASRCVPVIGHLCREGHQVVLGGDGDALFYLQQRFPTLPSVELAPLRLRYSKTRRQVLAMLCALPKLIAFSLRDHRRLRQVQAVEHFDLIISDNRFGLYLNYRCVYITHQLHIFLPKPYKWLEPLVSRVHACIYKRYDEVWVPDTADHRLSGDLSEPISIPHSIIQPAGRPNSSIKYIGPLSRFTSFNSKQDDQTGTLNSKLSTLNSYKIVAMFSGLEPHRTLFEQAILERFKGQEQDILLVNGKLDKQLSDSELAYYLTHAEKIIARSGYSTIMDLDALGVLDKAELIPTPGQPEQEYLAQNIAAKFAYIKKK